MFAGLLDDWLVGFLVASLLVSWFTGLLVSWLVSLLVCWLAVDLVCCLVGCLVCWGNGPLLVRFSWKASSLACLLVGVQSVGLSACELLALWVRWVAGWWIFTLLFVGQLACLFVGQLVGWNASWLASC